MGKSLQTKQIANEVLWIVVGCLLYSLSVVWFIDPAQIIPGSVTGIAVVTKALFGIPIGVLNLVVNIPLVLIGVFYLGKKLLVYTALTVFLNSVLMDQLAKVLQPMTQDIFLASVIGGVMMGIGLGMILKAGATTGGTTVVGRLVVRKYPNLPISNILLVGDFIIITVGSILLKNWDLFLYSVVDLYICVLAIDKVYEVDRRSAAVIYSGRTEQVAEALCQKLPCRVAVNEAGESLTCYYKKSLTNKVQKIVQAADPEAVCAITDLAYAFGDMESQGHVASAGKER